MRSRDGRRRWGTAVRLGAKPGTSCLRSAPLQAHAAQHQCEQEFSQRRTTFRTVTTAASKPARMTTTQRPEVELCAWFSSAA